MKTRIISATVGIALFIGAIVLALCVHPIILNILLALVGAIGVYEALYNTKYVKSWSLVVPCLIFALATPFAINGYISVQTDAFVVLLCVFVLTLSMFKHKTVTPLESAYAVALTLVVTYCFSAMAAIFGSSDGHGLFYMILMFIAAWSCDTGAYFTGYFFGKHKMAPEISPKKTIEGAIGGIITSVVVMVAACLVFGAVTEFTANTLLIALLTPILSFAGMMGDLVASYIKRASGIKDYGNIMPGHGGVIDRFDSVMMIAPIMYVLLSFCSFVV